MTLRVIRLYPLYLLGCALGLVALILDPAPSPAPVPLMVAMAITMMPLPSAGLYPLDAPAWSLLLELIANLAYGFCARIGTTKLLVAIIATSGVGIAVTCVTAPDHSLDLGWTIGSLPGGIMRVAFSFSVGILLRHLLDDVRQTSLGPMSRTSVAWGVLGILTLVLTAQPYSDERPVFELAAVLLFFPVLVFMMLLYEPNGCSRRLFHWLGTISYPVYVLHMPLAHTAATFARAVGRPLSDFAPWSGAGFLVVLVVLCWWLDKTFDRPVRRRLIACRARWTRIGEPPTPHHTKSGEWERVLPTLEAGRTA